VHLTARPVTARRPKPLSWHTGPFPAPRPAPPLSRRCFGLAARHSRFRCVPRPRRPTRRSPSPAASRASRTGRGRGHRQPRQLIARSARWRSETTRKHPAICQDTSSKRPKPAGLPPACLHRTVTAWRLHGMRYPTIGAPCEHSAMPHLTRAEQSVLYARMHEPKSGLQTGLSPYRLYSRVLSARSRLAPMLTRVLSRNVRSAPLEGQDEC
jgi:hypothetical protein